MLPALVLCCQLCVGLVPAATAVKVATLSVHTVALTGCVAIDTGWLTVTTTVVAGEVQKDVGVKLILQPPAIEPKSPPISSKTNNFQSPLTLAVLPNNAKVGVA